MVRGSVRKSSEDSHRQYCDPEYTAHTTRRGYNTVWSELCECIRDSVVTVNAAQHGACTCVRWSVIISILYTLNTSTVCALPCSARVCAMFNGLTTVAHSCHVKKIIWKFRDNKSKFRDNYLEILTYLSQNCEITIC